MMCFDSCVFPCMLLAFTNAALEGLVYGSTVVHINIIPVCGYVYLDIHLHTVELVALIPLSHTCASVTKQYKAILVMKQ